jgi:hypothetical protein
MDGVPEEWASTWVRIHQPGAGVTAAELVSFFDALATIRRRFVEVHPEAARNREVSRQATILLSRLILRLVPLDSLGALRRYAALLVRDPAYAIRILPKFAALFIFGNRAHDLWQRVRKVRS